MIYWPISYRTENDYTGAYYGSPEGRRHMAFVAIASIAPTPHFERGQRGEARSIRRIVNFEALIVVVLLLAACVFHLA